MKNIFKLSLIAIFVVGLLISCEDSLNKLNPNEVTPESFYTDLESINQTLMTAYMPLTQEQLWSRRIIYTLDWPADDMEPFVDATQHMDRFDYIPQNDEIFRPWRGFYLMINRANQVMIYGEELEIDDASAQALKERYYAEAKFLRALAYYYLTSMYKDVPLKTVENYLEKDVARTPVSEIHDFLEQDLNEAISVLPTSYDAANKGRVTKGAAQMLLGLVNMWQKDYSTAETLFKAVIDNPEYELLDDLRAIHDPNNEGHREVIFDVPFKDTGGTDWSQNSGNGFTAKNPLLGLVLSPRSDVDWHHAKVGDELIEAIMAEDPDDPRLQAFFFGPGSTIDGEPYDFDANGWGWRKYIHDEISEVSQGTERYTEVDYIIWRLADAYLLLAEALNEQGKTEEAVDYLNDIRERAREGDPTLLPDRDRTASQEQITDWIIYERFVELSGEGKRRLDLRRWDIDVEVLAPLGFVEDKHEWLPIPLQEIDFNKAISQDEQNEGW